MCLAGHLPNTGFSKTATENLHIFSQYWLKLESPTSS